MEDHIFAHALQLKTLCYLNELNLSGMRGPCLYFSIIIKFQFGANTGIFVFGCYCK